ncbi:hypothetical protein FLONG3_8380 [Fusarium longipes]|uniref:inosine/xanthosine triphosphatase n=1 Tax=Fusarium longipes TaxID=694270 RepID=A0A395S726_9HYPO|nr:hypothetical protein FLONG3_8380 [Fusarium longipes]
MTKSKIIVVIGATGGQGGSVSETFLQDTSWLVRGITRNPSSPKAKALQARGADIVQADLNDPESLAKAFQDATVIFAISDFWGIYSEASDLDNSQPGPLSNEWVKQKETQQLKNVIDEAAKVPSLQRFVISSLPSVIKLTGGKYTNACHFDSKANAVEYGEQQQPGLWSKTSVFLPGYFLSNFLDHPMAQPTKKDNGQVQFVTNLDLDNKIPFIAHNQDSGPFVKSLVQSSPTKGVVGYRAWLTFRQFVNTFSNVTGYKTEIVQLPVGQFNWDCKPEWRDQLREAFAFVNEVGLHGGDDSGYIHPVDLDVPPDVKTIEAWISEQDWKKVLVRLNKHLPTAMESPNKVVVVASNNIPKIKAASEGFRQVLPGAYDFQGLSVNSHVSDQPFSDEETLRGATNRAQNAQALKPEADFWVGIEGGVETHNGSICSFAWIVVIGEGGKVGKARTSAYFLPTQTCQLLKEGVELGHADDILFGQTDSKNKQGSVGLLTGGVVDRAAYYTQAVILALIPFRNASLDF